MVVVVVVVMIEGMAEGVVMSGRSGSGKLLLFVIVVVVKVVVVVVCSFFPLRTWGIFVTPLFDSITHQPLNLTPCFAAFSCSSKTFFQVCFGLPVLMAPRGFQVLVFLCIHPPSSQYDRSIAIFSF